MNANQNTTANFFSLGPAAALASVGNRDLKLASAGLAAVAHVGGTTFNYRASSGGGPKCWWSQPVCERDDCAATPSPATSSPVNATPFPTTSAISASYPIPSVAGASHSMLPAVQIPLLSPPLSINSPTQPVAPLDLAALSRQAAPPLTPESTPPVASALAAAARDRPSFFPSSLAPGFYDALLPEPAQAARARARSTVVEVVNARDGSIWTGALLEPEAAKAMALTSVDALESGAATGDELVLCVAIPTDAGVDIREGVEMIMDLASECLSLTRLVLVLEKASPDLRELLHGLLFIGGTLIPSATTSGAGSPVSSSSRRHQRRPGGGLKTPPLPSVALAPDTTVAAEAGERWTVSGDKVLVGMDL